MLKQQGPKRNRGRFKREKPEFDQKLLDVARVARVMKGGKRFSFRATMVIGDKKGRVGVGVGKGKDVKIASDKAVVDAKKNMIKVDVSKNSVPYQVSQKLGSAKIILKPASKGSGITAGGPVRAVLSLAGIHDVTSKILGAGNKLNNARAAIEALKQFSRKKIKEIKREEIERKKLEEKKLKEEKKALKEKEIKKEIKKSNPAIPVKTGT